MPDEIEPKWAGKCTTICTFRILYPTSRQTEAVHSSKSPSQDDMDKGSCQLHRDYDFLCGARKEMSLHQGQASKIQH